MTRTNKKVGKRLNDYLFKICFVIRANDVVYKLESIFNDKLLTIKQKFSIFFLNQILIFCNAS
jgi:hypothetical protein